MTDELRNIYAAAGLGHRYFDKKSPDWDLFRGQSSTEAKQGKSVLYPNPGFTRKNGEIRIPDVQVLDRDGKKIVKGCRCVSGNYRGLSTFDRKNPALSGFRWFKLPARTELHEALAITKDADMKDKPNHHTIAPKDDMPLELFLVCLEGLSKKMSEG